MKIERVNPMFHFARFMRKYEKEFRKKFLNALRVSKKNIVIEAIANEVEENLKKFYKELIETTGGALDIYLKAKIKDRVVHDKALAYMYDSLYHRGAERITMLTAEQKEMLGYLLKDIGLEISYDEYADIVKKYIGLNKPQVMRLKKMEMALREEGYSEVEIVRALSEAAEEMRKYRALMIARTELAFNYMNGQVRYMTEVRDDTGIHFVKIWQTSPDELTCEICSAMDGEEREMEEAFSAGVAHPPAHPNCRCYLIYERRG